MTGLKTRSIDALQMRRVMGREAWSVPEPFGPNGWIMDSPVHRARLIVTVSEVPTFDNGWTDEDWIHASISHPDRMPTYDELVQLKQAVFGPQRWAYQVFAPIGHHVNIHEHALHLWGRLDGTPSLPNFGGLGSI